MRFLTAKLIEQLTEVFVKFLEVKVPHERETIVIEQMQPSLGVASGVND